MARIDWVDRRLREWAQWIKEGDGSGYSAMSPLHQDWSIPTPGTTPTLKCVPSGRGHATHRALLHAVETKALSERLANTLVLHYCMNLAVAEQAARLGCQAATIDQRIRAAHAHLAKLLDA